MEGKAWQSSSSSSPMMTHEERRIQHNLYCQKLRNFCRSIESHQRLLKEFSRRSLKTRRDSQHSASVSPASRRFYDTRAASSSSRPRRPYSNVGSAAVARDGKKGMLGSYDGSQNGVQGFRGAGTVPPAPPLNPSLRCELSDTSNTARAQHLFYGEQVQPGDQRVNNSAGANINNIKHNYRSEPGGDWDRNTADLDRESHRTASTSAHTDGTHNAPPEGDLAKYTDFTGNELSSVVCSKVTKMKCRDSLSENTHRSRDSNSIGTSGELNMSTHGNDVHLHDVAKNKRIISMNGRNKGRRNLTSDEGKSETVSSSQNRQQNIHGDTNVKLGGKCARLINLSSPEAQTALLEAKLDMDVGCTLHDMEGSGSSTSRGHDATTTKSVRPPENEDHSDSIECRLATKTKHISLGRRESQHIKPSATEVLETVHNQNQHHASPYTVKTLKSTNSRSPRFGNESVRPITRSTKLPQIHNSWLQSSQESLDHQRNKNRFPANGKNSMPWLLGEREQTFEITPLGYDSRFVDMEWKSHYSDNLEHPNSEIVSRSVAKCMDWLNKCTSSG